MKTTNKIEIKPLQIKDIIKGIDNADNISPGDEIRHCILMSYKQSGGNFNDWTRQNASLMLECIIRFEDELELKHSGSRRERAREALRTIRRKLECEIYQ